MYSFVIYIWGRRKRINRRKLESCGSMEGMIIPSGRSWDGIRSHHLPETRQRDWCWKEDEIQSLDFGDWSSSSLECSRVKKPWELVMFLAFPHLVAHNPKRWLEGFKTKQSKTKTTARESFSIGSRALNTQEVWVRIILWMRKTTEEAWG